MAPAEPTLEQGDSMSRLASQIAIVTGTSPNIGGGIAQGLADEGAAVVCVDIVPENAQQCADWIQRRGGHALGIVCDVTDEPQVTAMVARVRDTHGRVDILVNNAGILGGLSVLEMPLERWNRQIAVNLTGTFLCTKHVARLMVEQGTRGSIIVIVSTAGHQGQAGNIAYCTSKSGLLNFTRAAAMDLARHGIRVNSLTPTATDAEEGLERAVAWGRTRPERRPGGTLDFRKMVPMGQLPSPRHYARAAVFLASDEAEMITGIDLRVDAGAIAKYWPWIPSA
jgi:NAD(P)-dependent dehydrogenase (short-subunit alcohol dehydrogenase family)